MITSLVIAGVFYSECERLALWIIIYSSWSIIEPLPYGFYNFIENNNIIKWVARIASIFSLIPNVGITIWGAVLVYKRSCGYNIVHFTGFTLLIVSYVHCCCFPYQCGVTFFKGYENRIF